MLARFDRDVIAERPDLVLWQVASNAIMRDRHLAAQEDLLRAGIARIKRIGADAVLIDPQYATAIIAHAVALPMVDLIAAEARRQQVATFRFALMRDWHHSQRIPFEAFSIADVTRMIGVTIASPATLRPRSPDPRRRPRWRRRRSRRPTFPSPSAPACAAAPLCCPRPNPAFTRGSGRGALDQVVGASGCSAI